MPRSKRPRKPRRQRTDPLTLKVINLFFGWVIDDWDEEALRLLQETWPEHPWTSMIADACRRLGKPLPFAKLLTYPGHSPAWSL